VVACLPFYVLVTRRVVQVVRTWSDTVPLTSELKDINRQTVLTIAASRRRWVAEIKWRHPYDFPVQSGNVSS